MDNINFWQNLPDGFLALAPMEDVTDIVFRHVVNEAAKPDVFFTEFTNAASFCSTRGNASTKGRLTHDQGEKPIVAQIWGTNPDNFQIMSDSLRGQGFDGIDINMGCPAKDVVKTGGGSGLISTPSLALELISAVKQSGLPVSVKTRLGVSRTNEYLNWLPLLFGQQISNLTIHLRTRKEMSKVPAHYELIDDICHMRDELAPRTTLTINGDVINAGHAAQLKIQHPGVNGFMIGRGIFSNPFAFDRSHSNHSQTELIDLFRYHLDQYDQWRQISPELQRKYDPLKHFFKIYIKDFDGAKELRDQLYHCQTTDQVRAILDQAFGQSTNN